MVTSPLTSLSTHTTAPAAILTLQKQFIYKFIIYFLTLIILNY